MTDVLLRHEADGGNIEYINGQATMSDDIEAAVYLSLYGGNERDSGLQDGDRFEWWGNKGERVPERRYRSQTQHLLRSLPALPVHMKRVQAAAMADLAWFTETGVATFVRVDVSIPALNTVQHDVLIEVDGERFEVKITRPWQAAA